MVFLGTSININLNSSNSNEKRENFLVPKSSSSPIFLETPADLTVNNNTGGYYLQWNVTDDNPHIYVIFRNDTGNTVQATGIWESGIFRYELPALNEGIYNFTLYLFDQEMNSIADNVTVTSTDLGLPTISDLTFIQGGKIVSSLRCGGGVFSVLFKNNTDMNITITPSAFDENLNIAAKLSSLGLEVSGLWPDATLLILPESLSIAGEWVGTFYDINSTQLQYSSGQFNLTPSETDIYVWMIQAYSPSTPIGNEPLNPQPLANLSVSNILDVKYGLINIFHFVVNEGVPFICNGSAYDWNDDSACRIEIENVDLNAPVYDFKDEYKITNTGYEISIKCNEPTAFESGIYSVELCYTINDGNLTIKPMVEYQGIWGTVIPMQKEATVKYYIRITDRAGNTAQTQEFNFIIEKGQVISDGILTAIIAIGAALALSIFLTIIFRGTTNVVIKKVEGLK
jgi:hypothetical protein